MLNKYEAIVENFKLNVEDGVFDVDYVLSCDSSIDYEQAEKFVKIFNNWESCEDKNSNNYFYIVENELDE